MNKKNVTTQSVITENKDNGFANKSAAVKNPQNPPKIKLRYYLPLMLITFLIRTIFFGRTKKTEDFKKQKKSGAMLILSNHVSNLDFIHMAPTMFGAKTNFVVAEHMLYTTPIFSKLILGYGAILKKQFFSDFQCIKLIKRNLDSGISVMLCPEGKVSSDGTTGYISDSTARLIKWLGYPVATVILNGSGLVIPKWAYTIRWGKVVTRCDLLFSKDEVEKLSKQDIYTRTLTALDHSEYCFQTDNGLKYYGKRYAEGLEKILFCCPKCGAEFRQITAGGTIKCLECGNSVRSLNTGVLLPDGKDCVAPERIDLWYAAQRRIYLEKVCDTDFNLSDNVFLNIENDSRSGYKRVAKGTLRLDNCAISFSQDCAPLPEGNNGLNDVSCTDSDCEFKSLTFPTSQFSTLANSPGNSVDLYDDAHTYRFEFCERKASTAYVLAIEAMASLRQHRKI